MSDLSSIEKVKLEKMFDMEAGYVLDFSNRTFQEFIIENTNIDIADGKYDYASGSKANRLRTFWAKEANYIVGKIISAFLEYWKTKKLINHIEISQAEQALFDDCYTIAERLKQDSIVENIDAIQPYSNDKEFSVLAKSIRESIQNNEPEVTLDRLHTYVVKYTKKLCDKYGISYDRNKPLHSLFGEYVKYLRQNRFIESQMTERILKSSISILESFNDVRNNQSLAHDNPILNYHESVLIFNNVSSAIKFIEAIEAEQSEVDEQDEVQAEWDEIPL
ncbi:abortive infection family protein [Microcoleus vaginatus GB1-A2]|uniref:abortive infection family protein n=1 Tax=Microcoleus vaginatus TaxID=119532 RepID=UPI001688CDD3|nr:abortive infection family protein [Microcoleus sp. FACHB-61]